VVTTECKKPESNVEALIKVKPLELATGISRFKWYLLAREKKSRSTLAGER